MTCKCKECKCEKKDVDGPEMTSDDAVRLWELEQSQKEKEDG